MFCAPCTHLLPAACCVAVLLSRCPAAPLQVQFNLADFVKRAYGTNYVETLRVQVHANCRLRRIYFSDRLYSEAELPPEFKVGVAGAGGGWADEQAGRGGWLQGCVALEGHGQVACGECQRNMLRARWRVTRLGLVA